MQFRVWSSTEKCVLFSKLKCLEKSFSCSQHILYQKLRIFCSRARLGSTAEVWDELVDAVEYDGACEVADELEDGRHEVLHHEAEEASLRKPVRDGVLPRVALVRPQGHAVELDAV